MLPLLPFKKLRQLTVVEPIQDPRDNTGSPARVDFGVGVVRAPVLVKLEGTSTATHARAQINGRDLSTLFNRKGVTERHSQR